MRLIFFFKQKTAYEMRISDWSSDVCSSDLASELAVERHMAALARKNLSAGEAPFFLGAGAYRHHVPASVDHLIQRGEFLTAYTPYQPEIAQGTQIGRTSCRERVCQ